MLDEDTDPTGIIASEGTCPHCKVFGSSLHVYAYRIETRHYSDDIFKAISLLRSAVVG